MPELPRGLSTESKRLMELLVGAGCTWRMSRKNHVIVRSPNGADTVAIPRNLQPHDRAHQNAKSAVARLLANIAEDS
jgi:hypothetical protein